MRGLFYGSITESPFKKGYRVSILLFEDEKFKNIDLFSVWLSKGWVVTLKTWECVMSNSREKYLYKVMVFLTVLQLLQILLYGNSG